MSINADKFFAHNPTLIGVVSGIKFWEDPIHGDGRGMIAQDASGLYRTDWFDLPEPNDIGHPSDFRRIYTA